MSITDPAEPVQPEGQGGEGTSTAPYQEWLDRIPEEVRGDVEPVFRDWDANTTRKFQEHAQYRDGWKAYEDVGVKQHDPEAVAWALQFYEASQNNPQAIVDWVKGYADQHGLTVGEAAQEVGQQQDDLGLYGPDPQQLEQLLEQKLKPFQQQLEQYGQTFQQQQQAQAEAEATRFIEGQLSELESKHGSEFNRDMVERFAAKYVETDPMNAIPNGWADFQKFRNELEKSTLQSKVSQPPPAEGGGVADVNVERPNTIQGVRQTALEFVRNQNRAERGL